MKKIMILTMCFLMVFSSMSAFAQFDDIDAETLAWAGEAVEYLSANKVIDGYPDGTFRPEGNVTRAEFAKMLACAFNQEECDAYYEDTLDHWAASYIRAACAAMYTGELFRPDDDATRADIAYAVAKATNLKNTDVAVLDKFSDASLVIGEMKENVSAAVENSIIIGYEDNTLRPNASVTRAEAAVIIYRALNVKDTPDAENPDVPTPPPAEDKPSAGDDHIYTLYPRRDVLLISSVARTIDAETGEEASRITYRIANDEKEYSSVIPDDTSVRGVKTSVSQLSEGDVFIMDTAFHGQIGYLYVFASFNNTVPSFDTVVSEFGDYQVAYGKVTDVKKSGKAFVLTIDNGTETLTKNVLASLDANLYSVWNQHVNWSLDSLSVIDPAEEDTYVFIRFTNGVATEIIVSDIVRN